MATNEQVIWRYLKAQGFSDAGAAGMMGNLYAESALKPTNLQNSYEKKLSFTDDSYTKAVDNGSYGNFVSDKAGYGLAQWTFWTRKEELLKFARSRGKSIGDLNMQLDFLMIELNKGYKSLLNLLKTTNSVYEASNGVLLQFEKPADQSKRVQDQRASFGQTYYDKYASKTTATKPTGGSKMKYNENNKPLVCMQTNSTCYKQTRTMKPLGILWHSTGANNPNLKRYIQPLESDANYKQMIALLGKNAYGNDYNHAAHQSGLNFWIGKLADGTVTSVQSMPWNYRPWGCGSGRNGSCNNGWIQFEICEDGLNDRSYFEKCYKEACEMTAYLCKMYGLDPHGTVKMNGVNVPVILCHADSYKLGLGSNHGDVLHWFPKFGKTMADVRNDVAALMKTTDTTPTIPEEDEDMTQEKFNEMMNNWINEQAEKDPGAWSAEPREWAEDNGLIAGDNQGRKMYKKFMTREELVTVLHRAFHTDLKG